MTVERKPLANTVWSRLDRKATAILEFTLRQYRTRISTWAVLGVGAMVVVLVLLFYIDAMNQTIEAFDNDGDSADFDGDGYPNGQEMKWGTLTDDPNSHPGNFDPPIPPDSPDVWVNEDDFDYTSGELWKSQGYDDDGDCRSRIGQLGMGNWVDQNGNNINCDSFLSTDGGSLEIDSDPNVDEDPDENRYYHEAVHRAFVLGFGKIGFVFILGIFVPLFLATGLIRDEISSGTMHYLVSKPISRAEILLYRLLGFVTLVWPYFAILTIIVAVISGFMGPSDGFFRFGDLLVWFGILLATCLLSLVYATIFMTMGIIHKYGVIAAIILGIWEFSMAMLTAFSPETTVSQLSIVHWAMVIVDGFGSVVWADSYTLISLGESARISNSDQWGFYSDRPLQGSQALKNFTHGTHLTGAPLIDAFISSIILIFLTIMALLLGQASFKGKEID